MAWPTVAIDTSNLDADTDSPALARTAILAMAQAMNALVALGSGAPAGLMNPYGGTTAPTGWLLCYGQAVSRTTYSELFAAIGTTWGVGDGSTTFNVPDMRGRIAAGKDDMGGSAASRLTSGGSGINGATLGATGGAETHTLTLAQIPTHTHGLTYLGTYATGGANNAVRSDGTGTAIPNTGASGGSGNAHNNAQPTAVVNYIIKI